MPRINFSRLSRQAEKFIPLILSGLLFVLFYKGQSFYHSPKDLLENDPNIVDLKRIGVKSRLTFGVSPLCDGRECWTLNDFDDGDWQQVKLPLNPNENLPTFKEYKLSTTESPNWVYYRTKIIIPERLLALKNELSVGHMFISHHKYEVFINGRKTTVSDGDGLGHIGNFPIPREDIDNKAVTITIKGSLEEGDLGIAHFGSAYLGPKTTLDTIYLFAERATHTFYLLFLLSKGAIFVVFALFYFFSRVQPGFKNFLAFAFFVTIENLFMGDFFADGYLTLQDRFFYTYACKALGIAGLLTFFTHFFKAQYFHRYALLTNIIGCGSTIGAAGYFAFFSEAPNFKLVWNIFNPYMLVTVAIALYLGVSNIRQWYAKAARGPQLTTYIYVTAFLTVYLLLNIDMIYFKRYAGYEARNIFDLAFFFVLAMVTAKDMGTQEKKIETLEGHMEEKHRMELELQEAAEIAKVFMPNQIPDWHSFAISSYHKPLTENSGDWYAFEKSPSGRFLHYIMCDITGHGVQAAIIVSACRSILSTFSRVGSAAMESPDFIMKFIHDLNWTLFNNGGGYHVSTILGLTFDPEKGEVHYICAGHPPPFYLDGSLEQTKPKILLSRNNLLGISAEFRGEMKTHQFLPGDQIITYTDGLPLGSNVKALRSFLRNKSDAIAFEHCSRELAQMVWSAETKRTKQDVNDDVSVVWFGQDIKKGA